MADDSLLCHAAFTAANVATRKLRVGIVDRDSVMELLIECLGSVSYQSSTQGTFHGDMVY